MAYEKALSLISGGGGKTFEAVDGFIKATPEEMEVGTVITYTYAENDYAEFVEYKGLNDNSAPIIMTIGLVSSETVGANTYIYNELEGGYIVKGLG